MLISFSIETAVVAISEFLTGCVQLGNANQTVPVGELDVEDGACFGGGIERQHSTLTAGEVCGGWLEETRVTYMKGCQFV